MCDLLNSAGRCSAICDHTGSRRRPNDVRRKRVVGGLQLLGVGGVPPDHEVGVGAQPADVVEAADDHVLLGEHLEERLDVGGLGRAVASPRTSRSLKTDHIV